MSITVFSGASASFEVVVHVLHEFRHVLAGVGTIFIDANNNGVLDTGERTTTTDASGNYTFENLGPGTYRIREVQQAGATQTTPNPAAMVAASGTDVSGVTFGNDFGTFQLISIRGLKSEDTNGNGTRDGGELALQGWTIYIDANSNNILDAAETRTITDASGSYSFEDLGPGTYCIREVQQSASYAPRPIRRRSQPAAARTLTA